MKKILILSILLISLTNCKKATTTESEITTETTNETVEENKTQPSPQCYAYNANGSKIELQMSTNNNDVTGTLTYELKEKDSNKGTFVGNIKDSILMGQYTFQSEGTESVREIAFLIKDNQLIEGYGDVITEGNTTKFKDKNTLNYSSNMPLMKTSCIVE
jgi:uncharacterized protein YxeA